MSRKKKTSGIATKSNPKLWAQAKAEAKRRMGGKHSARAMQLATKIYKKGGGRYKGKRKSGNKLRKWTKQDWGTSSGKKSSETGERYLPRKARKMLTKAQRAAGNRAKRKATRAGKQRAKYTKAERRAFVRATRRK